MSLPNKYHKEMVDPRFKKRKALDRFVSFKADADKVAVLIKHGINVSEVCRDAIDKLYLEIMTQGPSSPKIKK